MKRKYYSHRNSSDRISLNELYIKFMTMYKLLKKKDYFDEHIFRHDTEQIELEARLALNLDPFPIDKWDDDKLSEFNLFDIIEYLYDKVSKPGDIEDCQSETGFWGWRYANYDEKAGKEEYRTSINHFLALYRDGYELTQEGQILSLGGHGVQDILSAELPVLGDNNIDLKVQNAILKWKNRGLSFEDRNAAIRDLADAFEWLKKSPKWKNVLNKKDESALFDIANNFKIRHNNPQQKRDYDKAIWYSWIFHFYLATFHAAARMLVKQSNATNNS
jgi:hypothetical protein